MYAHVTHCLEIQHDRTREIMMTDEQTLTIVVEVVHDGDTFINQSTAAYNNTIHCYILLQKLAIYTS